MKWRQQSDSTGFEWYDSNCGGSECDHAACSVWRIYKTQDLGVEYWVLWKRPKQCVGFFPTSKEAISFAKEIDATGLMPSAFVDQRTNLDEIRAYVERHGAEARERRQREDLERHAREQAEAQAEAERALQEAPAPVPVAQKPETEAIRVKPRRTRAPKPTAVRMETPAPPATVDQASLF